MMKNKKSVSRIILLLLLSLVVVGIVHAKSNDLFTPAGSSKSALSSGSGTNGSDTQDQLSPINGSNSLSSGSRQKSSLPSLVFPIRAAFYYPWFPEAWTQNGIYPYTNYQPSLGYYDLEVPGIIQQQIHAMLYGNIEAGIASWWGQGTDTDNRMQALLSAAVGTSFKWSIYYEPEGVGNPDVNTLTADLIYLQNRYSNDLSFLRIDNRFVIFVYADANDGCEMVDRWYQANTINAYIVLKVFPGYLACANQPDGWHQYGPAQAQDSQGQYSYTISPGFWKVGENPQLGRDLYTWDQSIRDMVASGADFQLITTFNEWGEGTAVESAAEWATSSGYGSYLDALHNNAQVNSLFLPTVHRQGGVDPVIIAGGDIASCNSPGDEQTAALLESIPGTVITLGDNAYETATINDFNNCYAPSWGRQKTRTYPTPGNHDYLTPGATGYFTYFGAAAGDPQKGYYSYDIGDWHIIVLNSNCVEVGGCGVKSAQVAWLQSDLAAHPTPCTLAYWHHPLFSSGEHGNNSAVKPIWQVLYQAGVDLVLNGHDHDYERFAPQDPNGVADPVNGIREIVVGTGGKELRTIGSPIINSEVQNDTTWGVLKVTLHPTGYSWVFVHVAGQTFSDSGSATCH